MGEKRMFPTKILFWQAELDIDKFKREIKKSPIGWNTFINIEGVQPVIDSTFILFS
jgi:hypothetical protein